MQKPCLRILAGLLLACPAFAQPAPAIPQPGLKLSVEQFKAQIHVTAGRRLRPKSWPNGARVTLETLAQLRLIREMLGQYFNRDRPFQACVAGLVDLAHAACANRRKDLEGAEMRADGQRHKEWNNSI